MSFSDFKGHFNYATKISLRSAFGKLHA